MDGKWQLGFTKVFLKEDARAYLELKLGESIKDQVKKIQALGRGYLARSKARKFRAAYKKIARFSERRFLRAKLRNLFKQAIGLIKTRVIKIQRLNRCSRINDMLAKALICVN